MFDSSKEMENINAQGLSKNFRVGPPDHHSKVRDKEQVGGG